MQKKVKFVLQKNCLGGTKCPCTPCLINFQIDNYFSFHSKTILSQNFLRVGRQYAPCPPSKPCLTSFHIFTKKIYKKLSIFGQQWNLNQTPLGLSAFMVFDSNSTVTLKSLTAFSQIPLMHNSVLTHSWLFSYCKLSHKY